jgi:hypothetical protein
LGNFRIICGDVNAIDLLGFQGIKNGMGNKWFPPRLLMFLPGIPLEPPLAGMIAIVSVIELLNNWVYFILIGKKFWIE